jgi:hypothetical protein
MDDSLTYSLCSIIRRTLEIRRQATGATLGAAIRASYPDVDLKLAYGGLRHFISTYCSESVVRTPTDGGDDVYSLIDGAESTPWDAFNNPSIAAQLAVHASTGELHVVESETPLPDGCVAVGKLTREDYRDMASRFLEFLPQDARPQFEEALTHDNFWPRWTSVLRHHSSEPVYRDWGSWRLTEITRLFTQRLVDAELSPDVITAATTNLTQSRDKTLLARRQSAPSSQAEGRKPDNRMPSRLGEQKDRWTRTDGPSLHDLVHTVIDRMTEDEVRRLWLPVGVVIDAVNQSRS